MPVDYDKIRMLRMKAGLTLDEAAKKAGLASRQAWHGVETGRIDNPGIKTLEAIAKALGVTAKDLLK